MVSINNSINDTVGASNSGATNTLTVQNPSTAANSQASELITVGGTAAGNIWTQYTVGSAQSYSMGVKNSALAQDLQINTNASGSVSPGSLLNTLAWKMSSAGVRNMRLQPSFYVSQHNSAAGAIGGTAATTPEPAYVLFGSKGGGSANTPIQQGNSFTQMSVLVNGYVSPFLNAGVFTTPVDGFYYFAAGVYQSPNVTTNLVQGNRGTLRIITNPGTGSGEQSVAGTYVSNLATSSDARFLNNGGLILNTSVLIFLIANTQVIAMTTNDGTGGLNINVVGTVAAPDQPYTFFSGCLLF